MMEGVLIQRKLKYCRSFKTTDFAATSTTYKNILLKMMSANTGLATLV